LRRRNRGSRVRLSQFVRNSKPKSPWPIFATKKGPDETRPLKRPEPGPTLLLIQAGQGLRASMNTRQPTIGLCRHVALFLRQHSGAEAVDRAVEDIGLPHPLNTSFATTLPVEMEAKFVQAAADVSGDIDLPLRSGVALNHAAALPGYVAQHARTLREALIAGARSLTIVRPGMELELQEVEDVAILRLSISNPELGVFRRHLECVFAGVIGQIRAFTARPFNPETIGFQHDRFPAGKSARAGLGCPVEFGANGNEMVFRRQALEREIRGRDDALHAFLVAHGELIDSQIEDRGVSFAEKVELYVQRQLPGAVPNLDTVARDLGISRRTLSRRLSKAGTSFPDILAKVRIRMASLELRETEQAIGDIAWRLGYNSPSAFSLAFRRATGQLPRDYRRGEPRSGELRGDSSRLP
jgi:AraC-like DNA-binding protein